MKNLVDLALERVQAGAGGESSKSSARRRSPAMDETLREAFDAAERKDADAFADALESAIRISRAEAD